jgi:hypothetical protein
MAPAPAAPDAPADGLHVAGGASEPSAIAALAYEIPDGATAESLSLTLAGVSPSVDGLRACTIPLDAAGFEPAQNGAWPDRPAYDCDAGAVPVVVDGATATFDVGALQQGTVLAIALVPGSTDRASIEKPSDDALAVTTTEVAAAAVEAEPTPMAAPPATAEPRTAAFTPPPTAAADVAPVASTPATGDVGELADVAPAVRTRPDDSPRRPWRTRVGGALGFLLLLSALLFYSQGRGLLGARVGNT